MVKDNTIAQFVPKEIRDLGRTKQEHDLESKLLQNHNCDLLECVAIGKYEPDNVGPSGVKEYLVFYQCPECKNLYYEDSPPNGIFTRMTKHKILYKGFKTHKEIKEDIPNMFCDEGLKYIQGK